MAKPRKPNAARKPPVPSDSHADIEDWIRAPDAGSASDRQAVGRIDLRDDPRASIRRQVEEGVLRVARTRVDHRDGRLRRP
jgi:hypothetical protein